jgi:hypothetical protein
MDIGSSALGRILLIIGIFIFVVLFLFFTTQFIFWIGIVLFEMIEDGSSPAIDGYQMFLVILRPVSAILAFLGARTLYRMGKNT